MTDPNSEPIPKIETFLKAFARENLPPINEEASKILMSYYGDDINRLEGVLPEDHQREKSISVLKQFYSLVFDKGLQKKVSIEINGVKQEENSQYLLSRPGWLDQIKRRSGDNFENLSGILMLDVANLSGANNVSPENGDLLLLRVARLLNESLDGLPEEIKKSYQFIPCRYGGDEFAVAVIKNAGVEASQINLEAILQQIKDKISQQEAYYSVNGQSNSQKIELKEDATKVISLPNAGIDREIFIWAVNKGSVINQKEIEFLKQFFGKDENKIREYLKKNQRPKRDYSTEALFLMHDLASKHPELAVPLYLANLLDQKANDENHTRLISVLRFVDEALYDPLLGEMVNSFEDFKNHLEREEFSSVFGMELKFVKEVNDSFSMVVADEMIKAFYQVINNQLGDEADKVKIFRRGGSFFIGLKKGATLSEKTIDKLKRLTTLKIDKVFEYPVNLEIPVSPYQWENPDIKKLGEFMGEMDKSWYQVVKERNDLPEDLKDAKGNISVNNMSQVIIDANNPLTSLTLTNLYRLFFGSKKRGEKRREEFKKTIIS
ncbi:MAG: hypothetical protein ACPLRN_00470 [Microgenomates group bacterium]